MRVYQFRHVGIAKIAMQCAARDYSGKPFYFKISINKQ